MELRLYALLNCPHCQIAKAHLTGAGVKFEYVDSGKDPVAQKGIEAILGQSRFPMLVAMPQEGDTQIVVGYNEGEYGRIVGLCRVSAGPEPINEALAGSNYIGNATKVVGEPVTSNGGVITLPVVPGDVDDTIPHSGA